MKRILCVLVGGFALAMFPRMLPAQEEPSLDPLSDIAADMNAAAIRLGKLKTDKPTQKSQEDAIAKLDLLIKELEKQCENCKGGSRVKPNPTRPAQASTIRRRSTKILNPPNTVDPFMAYLRRSKAHSNRRASGIRTRSPLPGGMFESC